MRPKPALSGAKGWPRYLQREEGWTHGGAAV